MATKNESNQNAVADSSRDWHRQSPVRGLHGKNGKSRNPTLDFEVVWGGGRFKAAATSGKSKWMKLTLRSVGDLPRGARGELQAVLQFRKKAGKSAKRFEVEWNESTDTFELTPGAKEARFPLKTFSYSIKDYMEGGGWVLAIELFTGSGPGRSSVGSVCVGLAELRETPPNGEPAAAPGHTLQRSLARSQTC